MEDQQLDHENIPFTMVANPVLSRKDISLRAKGLFAYLFSKPQGWQFSADRMAKENKDGRKAILAALQELQAAGLLARKKLGTGRVVYKLTYSKSQSANKGLRVDEPKSLKSSRDFRHGAERALISNTDTVVINNINKKERDSNQKIESVDEMWIGQLAPFARSLSLNFMKSFENHWRAKNPGGPERWQLKDIFDMAREIDKWKEREKKFEYQDQLRFAHK